MKVRSLLHGLTLALLSLGLLSSCAKEEEDGSLTLYYPQVTNIGPSMNFISDAPSYHGPKPSSFAITGITLDGTAIETASFSISETSGAVTIANTDGMSIGSYAISISCVADGRTWNFKDIFKVKMLPIAPEKIEASESVLEIPYAELLKTDKTVSVVLTGESVSIQSFSLIQEEGKEYFKISKDGVISVNTSFKGDFMPGTYPLTLKVVSYAGEATYENFVTVKITSAPLTLTYPSETGMVETGRAFTSGTPVLKGSDDGLAYSLKAVTPSTDKISVDPSTGVISVAEGNDFAVGSTYVVDVTVKNDFGTKDFESVMTLNTVAFIQAIDESTFKYAATEAIQGSAWSVSPDAGLVGDQLTFSLEDVPDAAKAYVSIDAVTGAVSAAKSNSIPAGKYSIKVKAENIKSSASATLALTVVENPYFFSYIRYGNNIGLANDGTYANQFRVSSAADLSALDLVPTTDVKAGTKLVWSVVARHNCASSTIDEDTGKLTMTGFKANNEGLILVTATAGKGTAAETSVTVPVFFSFLQPMANGNLPVDYRPFVIQANPRKGVRSAVPVAVGIDNASNMLMDYRRTFNYYNIAGPDTHISGVNSLSGSFANLMWKSYFTQLNKANNTGSKDPVSYYSNTSNLAQALLYVDATDKSVVVNANKWIDDDGVCANGAFSGQITYVTDGNQAGVNSGTQIFPIWIWFDERF